MVSRKSNLVDIPQSEDYSLRNCLCDNTYSLAVEVGTLQFHIDHEDTFNFRPLCHGRKCGGDNGIDKIESCNACIY